MVYIGSIINVGVRKVTFPHPRFFVRLCHNKWLIFDEK